MKVIAQLNIQNAYPEINENVKKSILEGRWYHFQRTYLVKVATNDSQNIVDQRYFHVTIHIFERIAAFFCRLIHVNYYKKHLPLQIEISHSNNVEILASDKFRSLLREISNIASPTCEEAGLESWLLKYFRHNHSKNEFDLNDNENGILANYIKKTSQDPSEALFIEEHLESALKHLLQKGEIFAYRKRKDPNLSLLEVDYSFHVFVKPTDQAIQTVAETGINYTKLKIWQQKGEFKIALWKYILAQKKDRISYQDNKFKAENIEKFSKFTNKDLVVGLRSLVLEGKIYAYFETSLKKKIKGIFTSNTKEKFVIFLNQEAASNEGSQQIVTKASLIEVYRTHKEIDKKNLLIF